MSDDTYNGWKNYPTWAVNLWLCNDEVLAEEAAGRVSDMGNADRVAVADMLREWVTDELAPDLGASFAADLMGWALAHVDWLELATAWIDAAREY